MADRSTDRLATNLPQPCSCHTHMQGIAWHCQASRMLSDVNSLSPPLVPNQVTWSLAVLLGVLLQSGCLVRSLGALRNLYRDTCGVCCGVCACESDVLTPHIVFHPVRVNSRVRPLGSRSLFRLLVLVDEARLLGLVLLLNSWETQSRKGRAYIARCPPLTRPRRWEPP